MHCHTWINGTISEGIELQEHPICGLAVVLGKKGPKSWEHSIGLMKRHSPSQIWKGSKVFLYDAHLIETHAGSRPVFLLTKPPQKSHGCIVYVSTRGVEPSSDMGWIKNEFSSKPLLPRGWVAEGETQYSEALITVTHDTVYKIHPKGSSTTWALYMHKNALRTCPWEEFMSSDAEFEAAGLTTFTSITLPHNIFQDPWIGVRCLYPSTTTTGVFQPGYTIRWGYTTHNKAMVNQKLLFFLVKNKHLIFKTTPITLYV